MKNDDLQEDVAVMTEVFKNAMTFEKYVKIWSDTLNYINSLLTANSRESDKALAGIIDEQYAIATVDETYDNYQENSKKVIRKSKKISFIMLCILASIIAIPLFLYIIGLKEACYYFLLAVMQILGKGGVIVIIALIVYNRYKVRNIEIDIERLSPQDSSQRKSVAENNIKAYNEYLKKLEIKKEYLLSKKQEVQEQCNKARTVLNQIYALDLIPKKYCGLVEASTIYGYLNNRICTCIGGRDGVYARYEDDLQHAIIVNRLDMINHKLDIVIKNQNKLYDVVCSIDGTLDQIKSEIERGNSIMSDIRSNTAISATAAQQSVAAQNYMAYWK